METKAQNLVSEAMSKIHQMADANTIIGDKIEVDGSTIIPISKVSYGFAGGGTDIPKNDNGAFGGGLGAGMTIQPLGFIVITDGDIRLLQLNLDKSTSSAIVNMVPEVFTKVQSLFAKKDKDTADAEVVMKSGVKAEDVKKAKENVKDAEIKETK